MVFFLLSLVTNVINHSTIHIFNFFTTTIYYLLHMLLKYSIITKLLDMMIKLYKLFIMYVKHF